MAVLLPGWQCHDGGVAAGTLEVGWLAMPPLTNPALALALPATQVETAILFVAASVLRGEGFTYTLPSRSKTNQLYVPGGCAAVQRGGACCCVFTPV